MTKARTNDFSGYDNAIGRDGWLLISECGEAEGRYSVGTFFHPSGIVDVYVQDDYTRLSFARDGRLFHRSWEGSFGRRTILQLARQFVADMLEQQP